jgi:hypothetical protein
MDGPIATIVADPRLVGVAVPLAVGLVIAAILRLLAGRERGAPAMLGAPLAFLLVYLLIEGLPPLLAVTAKQKLFWLAGAGALLGSAMQAAPNDALDRALLVLVPAIGLLWLGERQWLRGPETGFVVLSALLWLGAAAILLRLRATNMAAQGLGGGVRTVVAAAGLACVALLGGSVSLATLAGALAAGLGGVLLLDYAMLLAGHRPFGLDAIGRIGAALPLMFLAAILVLFGDGVSAIAVALLGFVFVSGRIPVWAGRGAQGPGPALEPVRAALLALLPAALAAAVAWLQADLTGYP